MTSSSPALRHLRVVVLPNRSWQAEVQSFRPGEAPDPDRLRRLLAERGIDFVVVDPLAPPYNPWGHAHPFFAGLDPVRALLLLLRHRSADLVISVFESGALFLLLLRRPFFFKPPIALWDVAEHGSWRPRRLALNLARPIHRTYLVARRRGNFGARRGDADRVGVVSARRVAIVFLRVGGCDGGQRRGDSAASLTVRLRRAALRVGGRRHDRDMRWARGHGCGPLLRSRGRRS